jgi:25S rRNA (uracil2634-N3)-methyltransferase
MKRIISSEGQDSLEKKYAQEEQGDHLSPASPNSGALFGPREFVHTNTLDCAESGCIACLYKIFPTGIALGGASLPPNVRPELCPRSKRAPSSEASPWAGLYTRGGNILTVGDGDLSFSLGLARLLSSRNISYSLRATTHESESVVLSVYPLAASNITELEQLSATVLHDIDATRFRETLGAGPTHEGRYDVIAWNFPCVRVPKGADGQVSEIETNKALLRGFFANCAYLLKPLTGELHVTHKTIEPFSWWKIADLAQEEGFELVGTVVFDRYLYPGYVNRKVLDNKSFPLHDARVSKTILNESLLSQVHTSSINKTLWGIFVDLYISSY